MRWTVLRIRTQAWVIGLGNNNPRLYSLGATAAGFHDLTTHTNSTSTTPGFIVGPGYDRVTG